MNNLLKRKPCVPLSIKKTKWPNETLGWFWSAFTQLEASCSHLPWPWLLFHLYLLVPSPGQMCGFPYCVQWWSRLWWKPQGLFIISWLCRGLKCWEQMLMFRSHRKRVRDVERRTVWVEFSHTFLLDGESRAGVWSYQGRVVFLCSFFPVAWASSQDEDRVLPWSMIFSKNS